MAACKSCPGLPKNLGSVTVPSWRQTTFAEFQASGVGRGHTFRTSSRWGEGGQVKNGQNSDRSGWLQRVEREGGDPQELNVHNYN